MPPVRTLLVPLLFVALATGCSTTTTYRRPATPAETAWILDKPGKSEVELVIASPTIGMIGGLLTGGIGAAIGAAVGKDTTIRF